MANVNGMQASMGLSGVYGGSQEFQTPWPADVSMGLMVEAAQRQQQNFQTIESTPLGAPAAFRQQYQQQMAQIQAHQSMNPYAARMFEGAQGRGSQQYLPSPLTMTPPSTGVFRPPPQQPSYAPIAPVYTPSTSQSWMQPFTPQAPQPMFRSQWEQDEMQRVIRENRRASFYGQVPGALGYGAGIAAGAGAGALAGSRFGGRGALIGAGIGAVGAGLSGLAGGFEHIGQMLARPYQERQVMGAGIMNMSQNWVTAGSDLNVLGRGLSREASINLAGQIQNLSGESRFQRNTGEMFNAQDLMQIMRKGGEAGLFDMAQELPQIKEKLRETAGTIKQFMELTNDPSITSVIQQMGRLQQFGLNQQEMVGAARGMRRFAKAAGTTIDGLQQIGGLPGAATFQQAGLTAGQGFMYGNYAAAGANQMVAAGALTPRQLALMGGVQGIAQRDMQAQAAFASMPLFAASQAQFSGGQWGVNPATAGRGDGAYGMVSGSMQAMNQAVQRGGIGALATFQMKQRELSDATLSQMTPMEQMAQRMKMAMSTGQQLGLSGMEALSVGGTVTVGADMANQMSMMARSPEFWENQRKAIRRRQLQLGQEEAARNRINKEGIFEGRGNTLGVTGTASWGRKTARSFGEFGEAFTSVGGSAAQALGDFWDEDIVGTDVITSRFNSGTAGLRESMRSMRGNKAAQRRFSREMNKIAAQNYVEGGIDVDAAFLLQAVKGTDPAVGVGERIGNTLSYALPAGEWGTLGSQGMAKLALSREQQQTAARREAGQVTEFLDTLERAKAEGGDRTKYKQAYKSLETAMGPKGKDLSLAVIDHAADLMDRKVQGGVAEAFGISRKDYALGTGALNFLGPLGNVASATMAAVGLGAEIGVGSGRKLTEEDYANLAVESIVATSKKAGSPISREEAKKQYASMSAEEKKNLRVQVTAKARERSKNKEAYDDIEGAARGTLAEQLETATNQRIERLRGGKYAEVEDLLDVDPLIGEGTRGVIGGALGFLFGGVAGATAGSAIGVSAFDNIYSSRDKGVQDTAAALGGDFGKLALVAAQEAGVGDQGRILKQLKAGKVDADEQEMLRARLAEMRKDEKGRKQLEALQEVGAIDDVTLEQLTDYGFGSAAVQTQTAFGSAGFVDSFGRHSKGLMAHLTASGETVTGESVAKSFTKEDIARMAKFGGLEGRRMAKLVERGQYTGPDKEKRKRALEAQEQITEWATRKAEVDEEGTEKQEKVKASGAEAKALKKDLKAIDEMAAIFADFKPAIKEFEKGTKQLSAAMESDAMARALEGD